MAVKNRLFPILLINFIGTLGFSIVLPFLVFLVTKFGGNAIIFGILGAVYPTLQLIGAPILGRLSDTHGRREILIISQVGTLISWIIFLGALFMPITPLFDINLGTVGIIMFSLPLIVLFFSRALDGITGGNVSVANAYLVDVTNVKDRSKNFGKMAMSSNLGFIIGPSLAGILGATIYGELLPVLAALIISIIATIVIIFYLPESKPCAIEYHEKLTIRKIFGHEHKDCYQKQDKKSTSFKQIMKMKNIPFMLLLYFLIFLGFNTFYTAFPIHVITELGWSIFELGIFFSVLGFLMILVQGPVLSRISGKVSEVLLIVVGSFILGINFLLISTSDIVLIYLAAVFFAVGNGLMWPSFLSILSKVAGDKVQGAVQGFATSFGSLASIIGLITGGILYTIFGATTFIISAGIIFVVFLLSFGLLRIQKK